MELDQAVDTMVAEQRPSVTGGAAWLDAIAAVSKPIVSALLAAGAARITGGDLAGRIKVKLRFDLDDGTTLQLVSTLETATVESPEDVAFAAQYLTAPKG